MKVILSRKGFDKQCGRIENLIIDNKVLLPFPIPREEDNCKYEDLNYEYNGVSKNLKEILDDLNFDFSQGLCCHLDPDLLYMKKKDNRNNDAAFGQCGPSATYLKESVKVDEGDLFLFFSQFRKCEIKNGKYNYLGTKDDVVHLIWGYLQVGEILDNKNKMKEKCPNHSHTQGKYWDLNNFNNKDNVIYLASNKLKFKSELNGYGVFPFNEIRVLTRKGCSMANWDKSKFNNISILENHIPGKKGKKRKNSSNNPENCIYYKGQWQELGLEPSEDTVEWVNSLFKDLN
jgi:hypothetical protein